MTLEQILPFERASARRAESPGLVSHFEQWCDDLGIHPESFGAWDAYERSVHTAV